MNVGDLISGDQIHLGGESAVFIARTQHPIWPHLQLVIWKLADGSWSHDALDVRQDVGLVVPSTDNDRTGRLRTALLGGG